MARAGVYSFRDKTLNINEALELEFQKKPSNQGTRTFARDLRRFFLLTGCLGTGNDGRPSMTPFGSELLNTAIGSPEEAALWRAAMQNIALVNDQTGELAHPYQILLRLVRESPGLEVGKLALALEAQGDSESEFQRIVGLAQQDWDLVVTDLGVSEHHARNATKILPSIARQLGDLVRRNDDSYYPPEAPTPLPVRLGPRLPTPSIGAPAEIQVPRNRKVTSDTIARTPSFARRPPDELDFQDIENTRELLRDRLNRHEHLVQRVAAALQGQGYTLFEDPYDILGTATGRISSLIEVKTLNGSIEDETSQIRSALAQLLYYADLSVPSDLKLQGLIKIAFFESPISDRHAAFLQSMGLAVAWISSDGRIGGSILSLTKLQSVGLL